MTMSETSELYKIISELNQLSRRNFINITGFNQKILLLSSDIDVLSGKIDSLKESANDGLTEEQKIALANCFMHLAWKNDSGTYQFNNLVDALNINDIEEESSSSSLNEWCLYQNYAPSAHFIYDANNDSTPDPINIDFKNGEYLEFQLDVSNANYQDPIVLSIGPTNISSWGSGNENIHIYFQSKNDGNYAWIYPRYVDSNGNATNGSENYLNPETITVKISYDGIDLNGPSNLSALNTKIKDIIDNNISNNWYIGAMQGENIDRKIFTGSYNYIKIYRYRENPENWTPITTN